MFNVPSDCIPPHIVNDAAAEQFVCSTCKARMDWMKFSLRDWDSRSPIPADAPKLIEVLEGAVEFRRAHARCEP